LDARYHVRDKKGAVASESKICTEIGIELLKRGGNAADALVGTQLCVGVIGMYHSGIGGGGFMLVRDRDGQYEAIDFRETAPAAAYEDMFKHNVNGSILGGLASGVPGELRGLEYVHQKYGALPWEVVVRPSVQVARHGFPVTEDLVRYMGFAMVGGNNFLTDDPDWAEVFAPHGKLLRQGETIRRRRFADTLETIAKRGATAFYEGPIAESMVAAIQRTNGTMTLSDLRDYNVVVREPVKIDYRGYKLYSCGTPSSGSVALSTLKIVEGYDMSDQKLRDLNTHRIDEAMRFAYAAHNELGDPEFVKGMDIFEAEMLNASSAAHIRAKISDHHTRNVSEYDPKALFTAESHGTSHVVTADASGMSITLTSTVNLLFGSQVMAPETGIILNNEMNDFSIPNVTNAFGFVPSPANFIRPGKRPLSSITPVIVEYPDGSLYVSVGAAGGSRIITATIQALWHVLDHNLTMPEALAEPRFHDQLMPNTAMFEYSFDNTTTAFMKARGHNVTWMAPGLSAVQGIRRMANGTFEAAGEPRQKNSGGLAI
jgi:gamma-glutamyltranspeptidase/glutathione hydrolase